MKPVHHIVHFLVIISLVLPSIPFFSSSAYAHERVPEPEQVPTVSIATPEASPSFQQETTAASPPAGCIPPTHTITVGNPSKPPNVSDTFRVLLPVIRQQSNGSPAAIAVPSQETVSIEDPLADSSGSSETVAIEDPLADNSGSSDDMTLQQATVGGATEFLDTIKHLYSGASAVQKTIDPAIIGALCVSVIRGKVANRSGAALGGVKVSIHGRSDYGYTTTQNDGSFSLVVNGGQALVLNYVRDGYLPVQRHVQVARRTYAWADPVVLIPLDSKVTNVAINAATMQVVTGSAASDGHGQRTATLLVPAGTSAEMVMADGSKKPMTQLAVRATEYTIGDSGPDAMPGELPARSGYTYALEYSVDAALTAGASSVEFNQPIFHYVENFLNLPVGTPVPMGYYDRAQARWIASQDGQIIKIVNENAGLAEVDSDGDGLADTLLGMATSELQALAQRYNPGVSLWRVPITHFTPWDCNWPFSPPSDAIAPGGFIPPGTPGVPPAGSNARDVAQPETGEGQPNDINCNEDSSIIACQSQTLGEEIGITGTPYRLVYRSDRVRGRTAASTLTIPLTGATPPASLKQVVLEISIAGKRDVRSFSPAANQTTTFTWDGIDAYGTLVQGQRPVHVRIGYVYDGVYNLPASGGNSFGRSSATTIEGSRARQEVTLYREWRGALGSRDDRDLGLGGWVPDVLHRYDPEARKIYFGNGDQRTLDSEPLGSVVEIVAGGGYGEPNGIPATKAKLETLSDSVVAPDGTIYISSLSERLIYKITPDGIITPFAGTGTCCSIGDGRTALQARLKQPSGLALGPDGRLYIADTDQYRIRRIEANGTMSTVAGTGECCTEGNGGPATQANVRLPIGISFGPDGSYYFADWFTGIIRKVAPNGIISTVAGGGPPAYPSVGDGGPATQARLDYPYDTAIGPDGSLYIADRDHHRIRKVAPNGTISTIAGDGTSGSSGDGGLANAARLASPKGLDIGPDGSLYIADSSRIRKIAPDGTISTVVGTGVAGWSGDGGLATAATIYWPTDIDVMPDGTIYIADTGNHRIRKVSPGGIISTIAGVGIGFGGDGKPATQARLRSPERVVATADGTVYIADTGNSRIRRIAPNGIITSITGSQAIGDGGPALQAELNYPQGLALGPDGSLYVSDHLDERIRRIAPNGTMSTFAGSGVSLVFYANDVGTFGGDGGPAIEAGLYYPRGLAVDSDGSVYISDWGNNRIRVVNPDGLISTVAGTGDSGFSGDGGAAIAAKLYSPTDVAIGPDGSIYIADRDNSRVRRVTPNGIISTVAGGGSTKAADGIATDLDLETIVGVTVAQDGTIYAASEVGIWSFRGYIHQIGTDGYLRTIAGHKTSYRDHYKDNDSALQVRIAPWYNLTLHPDGTILFPEKDGRLTRIRPALPDLPLGALTIPSQDGQLLYDFDGRGYHLQTRHGLTGAPLLIFRYDAARRLSAIVTGDGVTTTIERDGNGKPKAIVSYYGDRTNLTLDANNFLASASGPSGSKISASYTSSGLLQQFTDPRGNTSRYEYDSLGYLVKATDRAGGVQTLTRSRSAGSEQVVYTDQLGKTTTYTTRDLNGTGLGSRTQSSTGLVGLSTQHHDGSQNALLAHGGGMHEQLSADPRLGALAPIVSSRTITTPGGLIFREERVRTVMTNDDGTYNQSDTIDVNGEETTIRYEGKTRTLTFDQPETHPETILLDAQGRILKVSASEREAINYSYDSHGRLSEMRFGERIYTLSYSSAGHLSRLRDPLGRTTSFTYNADGQITSRKQPDGGVITFTYDASGNVTSVMPPGKAAHTFSYTKDDLLSSSKLPNGATTTYSYDAARQISEIRLPAGTIAYGYDADGRVISEKVAAGTTQITYVPNQGVPKTISAPNGSVLTYQYDGNLIRSETWSGPVSGSVNYTYNNDFRVTQEQVLGQDTAYSYDGNGRITKAGNLTLAYGANGAVASQTLASLKEQWRYNRLGEATQHELLINGTQSYAHTISYDNLGRIQGVHERLGKETTSSSYSYDLAGRLVTVQHNGNIVEQYSYDANGNRLTAIVRGTTTKASYNSSDQLLTSGGSTYSYDANGRLASRTSDGKKTQYSYDEQGRLLKVVLADGKTITYIVDGLGRRIGRTLNSGFTSGWIYDQQGRIIAELGSDKKLRSRFIYTSPFGAPAVMMRGGKTYRIISDERGSPRLVIDTSNGTVVQQLDFDSFGVVAKDTNPGFQPFGFAGGLYDSATGFTRFGVRDYDAQVGRWTAPDPIGFLSGDTNLYSYVSNDPLNFVDPTGLLWYIVAGGIVGAAIEGGATLYNEWDNPNGINWGKVGSSALGGAYGGALAAILGPAGASMGRVIAAEVVGAAAGNMLTQALDCDSIDLKKTVKSMIPSLGAAPFARIAGRQLEVILEETIAPAATKLWNNMTSTNHAIPFHPSRANYEDTW
jgi:RHS repeat-associated protein